MDIGGHVSLPKPGLRTGLPPRNLPPRRPPGPAGASSLGPGSTGHPAPHRRGNPGSRPRREQGSVSLCVSLCSRPLPAALPSLPPPLPYQHRVLVLPGGPRVAVKIMLPSLAWNVLAFHRPGAHTHIRQTQRGKLTPWKWPGGDPLLTEEGPLPGTRHFPGVAAGGSGHVSSVAAKQT